MESRGKIVEVGNPNCGVPASRHVISCTSFLLFCFQMFIIVIVIIYLIYDNRQESNKIIKPYDKVAHHNTHIYLIAFQVQMNLSAKSGQRDLSATAIAALWAHTKPFILSHIQHTVLENIEFSLYFITVPAFYL